MKVQQMAFMLIVLAIFFIMVGLFVTSYAFGNLKEAKQTLEEERTFTLLNSLANSPEFSCQNSFYGKDLPKCIDFDKAMALKTASSDYQDFWGISNVEIRVLSEKTEEEKECKRDNYPNCNYLKIISEREAEGYDHSTYVSLCRKAPADGGFYDKCEVAKLIVRFSADEE